MSDPVSSTPAQRLVGGLWCGDVLAGLPDYLEGRLEAPTLAAVEAHIAGCDWCARFGGAYASVVGALTEQLAEPEPVGREVADRLDAALDAGLDAGPGGGLDGAG